MESKQLPFLVLSLFCLFLMVLLILNMVENNHYKRILVDQAEIIVSSRLDELDRRFREITAAGESAFSEIDSILANEETSLDEAKELLDELDSRLKMADERIQILSYAGESR